MEDNELRRYTEKQLRKAFECGVVRALAKDVKTSELNQHKTDWIWRGDEYGDGLNWDEMRRWILEVNPDDGALVADLFPLATYSTEELLAEVSRRKVR